MWRNSWHGHGLSHSGLDFQSQLHPRGVITGRRTLPWHCCWIDAVRNDALARPLAILALGNGKTTRKIRAKSPAFSFLEEQRANGEQPFKSQWTAIGPRVFAVERYKACLSQRRRLIE